MVLYIINGFVLGLMIFIFVLVIWSYIAAYSELGITGMWFWFLYPGGWSRVKNKMENHLTALTFGQDVMKYVIILIIVLLSFGLGLVYCVNNEVNFLNL